MDIEGTYTLHASPREVWRYLLDPQTLQRTVPGVKQIEQTSENSYTVVGAVNQAPLGGSYRGQVTVSEQQYPYQYRISVEGEGEHGTFTGAGSISLNEQNSATVIAYKGSVSLKKTSSALQPTLVKGAAKLLIQQFFTTLASQLRKVHGQMVDADRVETLPGDRVVPGDIVIVPSGDTIVAPARDIFQQVAHRLTLGGGNLELEQRWANRLKQMSIASVLLFLVWVGMRLPRRR